MGSLPPRVDLPRFVAPLPTALEDLALKYAWLLVAINLAGTVFGIWFYAVEFAQLGDEPLLMWLWVMDSPLATFWFALSLGLWKLGRPQAWLDALAFVGCIVLGLWTPWVLLTFYPHYDFFHPLMYHWLLWSHLAVAAQAFIIHRYSNFTVQAILVAVAWYSIDLVLDFHIPILGEYHHSDLPIPRDTEMFANADALGIAGGGAVVVTVVAIVLALLTRVYKLKGQSESR